MHSIAFFVLQEVTNIIVLVQIVLSTKALDTVSYASKGHGQQFVFSKYLVLQVEIALSSGSSGMPSVKKLCEEISQMISGNWKKPFGMLVLALMEKTFPKKSIFDCD